METTAAERDKKEKGRAFAAVSINTLMIMFKCTLNISAIAVIIQCRVISAREEAVHHKCSQAPILGRKVRSVRFYICYIIYIQNHITGM